MPVLPDNRFPAPPYVGDAAPYRFNPADAGAETSAPDANVGYQFNPADAETQATNADPAPGESNDPGSLWADLARAPLRSADMLAGAADWVGNIPWAGAGAAVELARSAGIYDGANPYEHALTNELQEGLREAAPTAAPRPNEWWSQALGEGMAFGGGFAGAGRMAMRALPQLPGQSPSLGRFAAGELANTPGADIVAEGVGNLAGAAAERAGLPWWAQIPAELLAGVPGYMGARRIGQAMGATDAPNDAGLPTQRFDTGAAFDTPEGSLSGSLDGGFTDPAEIARPVIEFLQQSGINVENLTPEQIARTAEALQRGGSLGGQSPSTQPDVMFGAPEGNVRSDDIGGIAGLDRFNTAMQAIRDRAAKSGDPVIDMILGSTANPQQQTRSLFNRVVGEDEPDPFTQSTAEQAGRVASGEPAQPYRPVEGRVSSDYGPRASFATSGGQRASSNHNGMDIAAGQGTPIRAAMGGNVVHVGNDRRNGNFVRVRYDDGSTHGLAHMHNVDVAVGQRVEAGDIFGGVGRTGSATGNHVHWTVRDADGNTIDPATWAPGEAIDAPPAATDMIAPDEAGYDPLDDPMLGRQGEYERTTERQSPTNAQMESGEYFRQTDVDGGQRTNANYGPQEARRANEPYQSPLRTEGEQPRRPVDDDPDIDPGFWEARAEATRQYYQERFEDAQRRRQEQGAPPDGDPGQRYTAGTEPFQGEDGNWRMNDDGYVADQDGNPVVWESAAEAARWATSNRMAGDVDPAIWAANSPQTTLRRRPTSDYGQQQAAPDEAPNAGRVPEEDYTGPAEPPSGRSDDMGQRQIPGQGPQTPPVGGEAPAQAPDAAAQPSEAPAAGERVRSIGETEQVVTGADREVDTEFEVRELDDLITSDQPGFDPARQPRDRGKPQSASQVQHIAANLDPQRLGNNRQAAHGAPIIGPDSMVEVGNGRTMAIRKAYDEFPESVDRYQQMMRDKGYDIEGMSKPVLVRRRTTEIAPDDMQRWVMEGQEAGTMKMGGAEDARASAGNISPETMALYKGGSVMTDANKPFRDAWQKDTMRDPNEIAGADGVLNARGQQILEADMLAKAFDDQELAARLVERGGEDIKGIANVLTDLAPRFAQLKQRIAKGDVPGAFDVTKEIAEAAKLVARSRSDKTPLNDLISSDDMFGGATDPRILNTLRIMFAKEDDILVAKPRTPAQMRDGLNAYLDEAEKWSDDGFIPNESTAADLLEVAVERIEGKLAGAPRTTGRPRDVSSVSTISEQLDRVSREGNLQQRRLAADLRKIVDDDGPVYFGRNRTALDEGKAGAAHPPSNRIWIRDDADLTTVLHEIIHNKLIRRYGYQFEKMRKGDPGYEEAMKMIGLMNEARARLDGGWKPWQRFAYGDNIAYAVRNVDEFITMSLTDPKTQRWLQSGGLWRRMVDSFREFLGLPPRWKNMLEDALDAGNALIREAPGVPVRVSEGGATLGAPRKGRGPRDATNRIMDAVVGFDKEAAGQDFAQLKSAIGNPVDTLKSVMGGGNGNGPVAWSMHSVAARTRALAHKFKSDRIHAFVDNFERRTGIMDGKAVKETFDEAVHVNGYGRASRAYKILEPFERKINGQSVGRWNDKALERIANMLRNPKQRIKNARADEVKAAQELRDLFKETIDYRKAAGEDIGEVSDGYLMRWFDMDKVMADKDGFVTKASRLYRNEGMADKEATAAAEAWYQNIFNEYAGLDGGLGFFGTAAGGNTAKSRRFGKEADTLLADYYETNLAATLPGYFLGAARRAERMRRFGKDGVEGSPERKAWEDEHGEQTKYDVERQAIREELEAAGAPTTEITGALNLIDDTYKAGVGEIGAVSRGTRATVSTMHMLAQLGTLDRAAATSLGEMFTGFVNAGARLGAKNLVRGFKYWGREIRNADPDDAARWARSLGVVQDVLVNQPLIAKSGIEYATQSQSKVLSGFFRGTMLHQLTEGQRTASIATGRELLGILSGDLSSPNAKTASRARKHLADLGITDADAFAQRMTTDNGIGLDEITARSSQEAIDYGAALVRFSQDNVMQPGRTSKPVWATHPFGSLVFSLMSFSYGFKRRIIDRVVNTSKAAIRDRDIMMAAPAAGLAALVAFQYYNDTYIRPYFFGSNYDFDNETTFDATMRTLDRSGMFGPASRPINAMMGLRYRRGLVESLVGPAIGRPADVVGKVGNYLLNDNPNTNTHERAAVKAIYEMVVEPAIDAGAARYVTNPFARSAIILPTGSQSEGLLGLGDVEGFTDAIAGPEDPRNEVRRARARARERARQ